MTQCKSATLQQHRVAQKLKEIEEASTAQNKRSQS